MIELRTLGALELRGSDGAEFHSILSAPKRFAVLAYLALARPSGYRPRDELLALFWPEQDDVRARATLRQTLRLLRRALGADVVVSRGDEIGLAADRFWCDATAFEEALAEGRTAEAIELYRGPLLNGFHLPNGGHEFEEWRSREANRLRQLASRAIWSLAERAERDDDPRRAEQLWRRLMTVSPYDEAAVRRLIAGLAERGNRAQAVRAYEAFAARLARDLELEPSPETRELAERVRTGSAGDRRTAPSGPRAANDGADRPDVSAAEAEMEAVGAAAVDEEAADVKAVDAPASQSSAGGAGHRPGPPSGGVSNESGGASTRRRRTSILAAAAVLLACAAGAAVAWNARGDAARDAFAATAATAERTLAVLPFLDLSADRSDRYLSDGITEDILTTLAQVPGLRVTARTSSFAYRGTRKDARAIGRELDVGALLEGSVQRSGGRIRIHTQLIDARTGGHLWAASFDRQIHDIFDVQDAISTAILEALRLHLVDATGLGSGKRYANDVEIYRLHLLGRFHTGKMTEDGLRTAIRYFERALERDPDHAASHAAMARAYVYLADAHARPTAAYPKAKAAALRAIELDPTLAEAHAALGMALLWNDWDFERGAASLRRALELNPNLVYALSHLAWYEAGVRARPERALPLMERAIRLDPLSYGMSNSLEWVLYLNRDYDRVIEQHRVTMELNPNFFYDDSPLAAAYREQGRYDDALAEYARLRDRLGYDPPGLGIVYARMGRDDDARRVLRQLEARDRERYVPPDAFARIHAALGDLDRTFGWLKRAYEERSGWIFWMQVDPVFDQIRADPRYERLLERIGLR